MPCNDPACVSKTTAYSVAEATAQIESVTATDFCKHAKSLAALAVAAAATAAAAIAAAKVAAAAGSAAALTGVGFFATIAFAAGAVALATAAGVAIGVSAAAGIAAVNAASDYRAASLKCKAANDAAKTAWDAHVAACEMKCVDYKRFPCAC